MPVNINITTVNKLYALSSHNVVYSVFSLLQIKCSLWTVSHNVILWIRSFVKNSWINQDEPSVFKS